MKHHLVRICNIVALHLRLGYVSALLFITAPLVIVALIDIRRYDLSDGFALELLWEDVTEAFFSQQNLTTVGITLFFLLLVPSILAVLRIVTGSGPHLSGIFGQKNKLIISLCIICILAIGFFHRLTVSMQKASGFRGTSLSVYDFTSYFVFIVDRGTAVLVILTMFLVTFLGSYFIESLLSRSGKSNFFSDYLARAKLADLEGDYYPVYGRHILNFNSSAAAPLIRFIRKEIRVANAEYQRLIPGSLEATDFLRRVWHKAREDIVQLLNSTDHQVYLYRDTSRALEVVLQSVQEPRSIILSPYEHPSESIVATWIRDTDPANTTLDSIPCDEELLSKPWQAQKSDVATRIASCLSTDKFNIVVLSEVCYATGLIIKVEELIEEIDKTISTTRQGEFPEPPKYLIDGAHAVGNVLSPTALGLGDAYVFSGHKWLLSPEPCGFVLSRTDRHIAYDAWSENLPSPYVGGAMINGLGASLRLLEEVGLEKRLARSLALRERFEKKSNDHFDIIGALSGLDKTCMLTVRPKLDLSWRFDSVDALRSYLKRNKVNALVFDNIEADVPWIRLSFQYFFDERDIRKLSRILRGALKFPNMLRSGGGLPRPLPLPNRT